jgi:hypothetical protein
MRSYVSAAISSTGPSLPNPGSFSRLAAKSLRLPSGLSEPKLVLLHIHPRAAKRNALHPQTKFLLRSVLALQLNRPTCAHHPMPRQSRSLAQNANHLPRRARPSRRACNRPVTRYRACRQSTDAPHHSSALCFHGACRFPPRLRFQITLRHAPRPTPNMLT